MGKLGRRLVGQAMAVGQKENLNQPTPPLERRRVVVPHRARSCRQAANVVFLRLGFLQVHHVTPLVSFSGSYALGSAINPQFVSLKAFRGDS